MFKIGSVYRNNIGPYRVLKIRRDKMQVQYLDGKLAILSVAVQGRIARRLVKEAVEEKQQQEQEASDAKRTREIAAAARKHARVEGWFVGGPNRGRT